MKDSWNIKKLLSTSGVKGFYWTCSSHHFCITADVTNSGIHALLHIWTGNWWNTDLSWSAEGRTGFTTVSSPVCVLAFLSACNTFSPSKGFRVKLWMTEAGGHGGSRRWCGLSAHGHSDRQTWCLITVPISGSDCSCFSSDSFYTVSTDMSSSYFDWPLEGTIIKEITTNRTTTTTNQSKQRQLESILSFLPNVFISSLFTQAAGKSGVYFESFLSPNKHPSAGVFAERSAEWDLSSLCWCARHGDVAGTCTWRCCVLKAAGQPQVCQDWGGNLPDIWGWMPGCSLELRSWAWMVSTTRLKRLLGPEEEANAAASDYCLTGFHPKAQKHVVPLGSTGKYSSL